MDLLFPSKCPACLFQIQGPASLCRRCGCNILLLAKVQNEAIKWQKQGKEMHSQALYKQNN